MGELLGKIEKMSKMSVDWPHCQTKTGVNREMENSEGEMMERKGFYETKTGEYLVVLSGNFELHSNNVLW